MSDFPPPPPPPPPAFPPPGPPAAPPPGPACANCGAPVEPDQDWCLNCGAAVTTTVAGAGGWRTPLAIVSAVLLVAAAVLVFAFIELSGEADRVANAPVVTGPTGVAGATPEATVSAAPTGPSGPSGASGPTGADTPEPTSTPSGQNGGVGKWPDGETAFTVILFSETTRAAAQAKAKTVSGLSDVGILNSDGFSSLTGGYWVVFSGQYETNGAAQDAADTAQSSAPGAYAKEVVPK